MVQTALTRTCRQIRTETRLLPFKDARFMVRNIYNCVILARWLNIIEDDLRSIVWGALDDRQREAILRNGGRCLAELPQIYEEI